MKNIRFLIPLCLLFLCIMAYSQAGSPDPEFGGGDGFLLQTFFAEQHAGGYSIKVQPDGKILAAGDTYEPFSDLGYATLVRYLPDGSLDHTFNGNGKIFLTGPGQPYASVAVSVQPDGKIVLLVNIQGVMMDSMAIFRFNPDGSPDISFDQDGVRFTHLGFDTQVARAMTLHTNGKIIVAGYVTNNADTLDRFFVARYMPDGKPDLTLDGKGYVITTMNNSYGNVNSVLTQTDHKILVAGYIREGNYDNSFIARYRPDGSLDPTFGNAGKATFALSSKQDYFTSAILQPNGKIVLSSLAVNDATGKSIITAMRLNPDGSPDPEFHGDGIVTVPINNENDGIRSITLQPDGKILMGGYVHSGIPGGSDLAVVRLNTNGIPDNTFDNDGVAIMPIFSENSEYIYSIDLQPDGKLIATGYGRNTSTSLNEMFVARFITGLTTSDETLPAPVVSMEQFPNPFTSEIHLRYSLDKPVPFRISLIDAQGRLVTRLMDSELLLPGTYAQAFSLSPDLPEGMYFISLSSGHWQHSIPLLRQ